MLRPNTSNRLTTDKEKNVPSVVNSTLENLKQNSGLCSSQTNLIQINDYSHYSFPKSNNSTQASQLHKANYSSQPFCKDGNNLQQFYSNSTIDASTDLNIYNYESYNEKDINILHNNSYFMTISPVKQPKSRITFPDDFLTTRINMKYINTATIPPELIEDIYDNLIKEEESTKPVYGYMILQTDLNEKMRAVLIDWLIDVHLKFKLTDQSLYIAVDIIDRYLAVAYTKKEYLQLLGIASLFIACKYEEVQAPELNDFVFISDNTYTVIDILSMENHILQVLDYSITVPSIFQFFEMLCLNFCLLEREYHFGKYLLELFLLDYRINKYTHSTVACSVIYLLMKLNSYPNYHIIRYYHLATEREMKDCAKEICFLVDNIDTCSLKAVRLKYSKQNDNFKTKML